MLAKKIILIFVVFITTNTMPQLHQDSLNYTIKIITGDDLQPLLPFVADLRITMFCGYPYLYKGSYEVENADLAWFAQSPDSAIAIAYYGQTPIGFLSGCRFTNYESHFEGSINLFTEANLKPEEYYYFAEIIILPEHRGHHLSSKLFNALENYAHNLGYKAGTFITESHETHPLKPDNYKSLEPLWNFLQYKKTSLITYCSWPTYQPDGSVIMQEHPLTYWIKTFTSSALR